MALKIKINNRTLVRGHFLNTINKINAYISSMGIHADQGKRYTAFDCKAVMEGIKETLITELDELTEQVITE